MGARVLGCHEWVIMYRYRYLNLQLHMDSRVSKLDSEVMLGKIWQVLNMH